MICQAKTETVVLIHGLAAPRWVMNRLARSLRRQGYRVKNWGYPSTRRSVEAHAVRLRAFFAELAETSEEVCHLVTHSMGGIVARCALIPDPPANIGRVVMLGPPNHGSHVARWLTPYLGFMCQPLRELSDEPVSFVRKLAEPRGLDVGIIAAASDHVVSLDSTHLECESDHIVLPGRHGLLPLRRDTNQQVAAFLRNGRFHRADGVNLKSRWRSGNSPVTVHSEKIHAFHS
jgi:pimeloyl-ACP methyl ester carboxylesterase